MTRLSNGPVDQPARRELLIVDDDRLVLAMLSKGLRHAGYGVTEAQTGEQALDMLAGATPDLVILDIGMPGVSGLAVAHHLRRETRVPFMFLTAYGDEETVREATESGAVGYLVKPVETAQVVPAIEAGLARAADIARLESQGDSLTRALDSSRHISVAVGIIMERARVDERKAFEMLRSQARSARRPLQELARAIIEAHEMLNTCCS